MLNGPFLVAYMQGSFMQRSANLKSSEYATEWTLEKCTFKLQLASFINTESFVKSSNMFRNESGHLFLIWWISMLGERKWEEKDKEKPTVWHFNVDTGILLLL